MKRKKGFTLAELLIVVSIIAVLVAIAIPVFNNQLEKSREATDLANVRSAYAKVMAAANSEDTDSGLYDSLVKEYKEEVSLKQSKDDWQSSLPLTIGGISSEDTTHFIGEVKAHGKCEVAYNADSHEVFFRWNTFTLRPNYQWKLYDNETYIGANEGYYSDSWPCAATTEFLDVEDMTKSSLVVGDLNDSTIALNKGDDNGFVYQIGYFIVDPDANDNKHNKIYVNSGRQSLNNTFSLNPLNYTGTQIKSNPNEGKNGAKVAIQFFKVNRNNPDGGSVAISTEEARELEKLVSLQIN